MNMPRSYTMRARAVATQETRERIIGAILALCIDRWYDEVTLHDVAAHAGVAVQTVINHFGTKEGLLAAMLADPRTQREFGGQRSKAVPGDIPAATDLLLEDYERRGDAAIRLLALEARVPALVPVLAFGRAGHRAWVERIFPAALDGLAAPERERRVLLLVCATDVYTWKILRRDQGLSRAATAEAMCALVGALHPGRGAGDGGKGAGCGISS
jgi:AcrR family transcriptional regulator